MEPAVSESGPNRPSRNLHRTLVRLTKVRATAQPDQALGPQTNASAGRAPTWRELLAAALAVGVLSGLLELGILLAQLRGLQVVDWSTLMISRHAAWMIPTTGAAVVMLLTIVLVSPVLVLAARRVRKHPEANVPGPAWDWAGTVLGVLMLLGPLLTVRGFHAMAPVAVSLGVGYRIRHYLVRPTPFWRRRVHTAALFGLGVLGLLVLSQWRALGSIPARPAPGSATRAPNLLWIVVDTLRADRMSVYGYARPTTPMLETWAKTGITFDMARSTAPWTLPSHVSMFTGLLPSEHGACIDQAYTGPSPTLAEHLKAQGYATAGIVANVRMCNAAYGVGRGFDHYVDYPWKDEISLKAALSNTSLGTVLMEGLRRACLPAPDVYPFEYRQPAQVIATKGRQWLDSVNPARGPDGPGTRAPFFLFLNFMDVHGPYLPPAGAPRRFWLGAPPTKRNARPEDGWRAARARDTADAEHRPQRQRELDTVSQRLGDLYDDCIAGLDAELGRFLLGLRDAGMLANTWVVITADHGEHFGEHGHFGHGSTLYNEQTHVPLILIPPLGEGRAGADPYASLRGRRIGEPVSLRDLPATMSELLLPGSAYPFLGRSVARYWRSDRPEPPDPVLSELEEPRLKGEDFRTQGVDRVESIIDDDHVLIEYTRQPPELYALFEDVKQAHNLADRPDQGQRRRRMRTRLDELHHRDGAGSSNE
jgi:arylsulfatase A-like enzyme